MRRYTLPVVFILLSLVWVGTLWWYVHRDREQTPPVYAPSADSTPDRTDTSSSRTDGKLHPLTLGTVDPRKLLKEGQIEKVKELVAEDPRVAIYLEDTEWFRKLLDEDPTLVQKIGYLHYAAMRGHVPSVKLLLERKADPNALDIFGIPALYYAVKHPSVVKTLLDSGANANVRIGKGHAGDPVIDSTALHEAVWIGQVESAKLLLAYGAELNVRDEGGLTPLHDAVINGQPRMVTFLLDKQPDDRLLKSEGREMMGAAARRVSGFDTLQLPPELKKEFQEANSRCIEIIRILQARGVPADIFAAIALGDVKLVAKLLKRDPALANSRDDHPAELPPVSGLFTLVNSGDDPPANTIKVLDYQLFTLVNSGDDPPHALPPLHRAVSLNHKQIVALLLDSGLDLNVSDKSGFTALHTAAIYDRQDIAKLLIERKANVNAVSINGQMPLHCAVRSQSAAVVRLLLAAGAKINVKDNQGQTPLTLAEAWRTDPSQQPDKVEEIIKSLRDASGAK